MAHRGLRWSPVTYSVLGCRHESSTTLQWRHNECDWVSNHQPHDCLLNSIFRRRWKNTSKLRDTGLCEGNSPVTSDAENVSIWWHHHESWQLSHWHRWCDMAWRWQAVTRNNVVLILDVSWDYVDISSAILNDVIWTNKVRLRTGCMWNCEGNVLNYRNIAQELCRPSGGRLRPRRPAQRVLFRIAVPTTTAQTVKVVNFYSTTITIYRKSKGNLRFRRLVPLFVPIGVFVTTHDDGTACDATIGMWRHNQQVTNHERNGKPWFSLPK